MAIKTTSYTTKNGKTRKVKSADKNTALKNGAAGSALGADNKQTSGKPEREGA